MRHGLGRGWLGALSPRDAAWCRCEHAVGRSSAGAAAGSRSRRARGGGRRRRRREHADEYRRARISSRGFRAPRRPRVVGMIRVDARQPASRAASVRRRPSTPTRRRRGRGSVDHRPASRAGCSDARRRPRAVEQRPTRRGSARASRRGRRRAPARARRRPREPVAVERVREPAPEAGLGVPSDEAARRSGDERATAGQRSASTSRASGAGPRADTPSASHVSAFRSDVRADVCSERPRARAARSSRSRAPR